MVLVIVAIHGGHGKGYLQLLIEIQAKEGYSGDVEQLQLMDS